MKVKFFMTQLVIILVYFNAFALFAQEAQEPPMYLVVEYGVKPAMINEFEAVIKDFLAEFEKHNWPYPFYMYSMIDYKYYAVYPIENYGTIDKIYAAGEELKEKCGTDKWNSLHERENKTLEYYNITTYRYLPELSYTAENPRISEDELNFVIWEYYYFKLDKLDAWSELQKEWIQLYKDNNISTSWGTYLGDLGHDQPVCVYSMGAKSKADFYTETEKIEKILGEKSKPLSSKNLPMIKKYEEKTGLYRRDLSYVPKEE